MTIRIEVNEATNVRQVVPFLLVGSMETSLRFYVDGLGFEVRKRWAPEGMLRWCWLELGNAAVMLQELTTEGNAGRQPEGNAGLGVTLCFICEDALAIYHQALSRKLDPSRPFVGNGMWVTSLTDPDGYRLDFESDTDTPEETEYTP